MLTSSPESPLSFQKEVKRAEKSNVMDVYSSGEIESMTQSELNSLSSLFTNSTLPPVLGAQTRSSFVQKREFVAKMCEGLSEVEKETEGYLVCGSDAFFPFQDNVHRLARSGVKVIVAPGGSVQDEGVLQTAKDYEMTVFRTPWRLFHH